MILLRLLLTAIGAFLIYTIFFSDIVILDNFISITLCVLMAFIVVWLLLIVIDEIYHTITGKHTGL